MEQLKLGELVGWRGWGVKVGITGRLYLRSLVTHHQWYVGRPTTGDVNVVVDDRYRVRGGVYAFKGRDWPNVRFLATWTKPDFVVVGEVELWGEVHEYTQGYRAEYAYPHSFSEVWDCQRFNYFSTDCKRVLNRLNRRFFGGECRDDLGTTT